MLIDIGGERLNPYIWGAGVLALVIRQPSTLHIDHARPDCFAYVPLPTPSKSTSPTDDPNPPVLRADLSCHHRVTVEVHDRQTPRRGAGRVNNQGLYSGCVDQLVVIFKQQLSLSK